MCCACSRRFPMPLFPHQAHVLPRRQMQVLPLSPHAREQGNPPGGEFRLSCFAVSRCLLRQTCLPSLQSVEPNLQYLVPPVGVVSGSNASPSFMPPPPGPILSPVHQISPPLGHVPIVPPQQPVHNGGWQRVVL